METVGKNVIKLDFYKGYSCQFATANCIILGTRLGIPLSTTHCMVGSLFGIVLANKTSYVNATYRAVAMKMQLSKGPAFNMQENDLPGAEDIEIEGDKQNEETVEKDENSLNLKTVKQILMWWAATVPVALFVSYSITSLLLINEPASVAICP